MKTKSLQVRNRPSSLITTSEVSLVARLAASIVCYCDMLTAHCDELPTLENAHLGNANTAVGFTVNVTCEIGFVMSDNSSSVETTCTFNRTWSNDLSNVTCLRPCLFHLLANIIIYFTLFIIM